MPAPPSPVRLSRLAAAIRLAVARAAGWSHRRAMTVVVGFAVLMVVATAASTRLRVDPDIAELLPPSYASVRNVEALRARFGGVGYVVLLVEGGTLEQRRAFADAIVPRLETLPTVGYVDARRPIEFFEDRALWFVDRADLETLRDRLRARKRWHIERAMLDLDDEPPPSVDVADIEARYRARFEGALSASSGAYYEDADQSTLAVFVRPRELASDLAFAKAVVADVERVVEEERVAAASDLSIELTGRYKKRVDLQALLSRDLALASTLAIALVIGCVGFHFRRVVAVVLVMVPLVVGVTLTYAAAALLFGTLNILTAFIGAILLGIGIDNGIHILGRFFEARGECASEEEAVATAFGEAGRVSLAAALTIATAFGCLAWTDFRAFREFGLLAALGVVVVLGSYLLLLPALIAIAGRLPWRSASAGAIGFPGVSTLHRWSSAVFWGLGLLGFFAALGMSRARFDADFSNLDDADVPSFRRDREVNELLGRSQTPMVLLAPSADEAREAAEVIRSRMRDLGPDATIGSVSTLVDLIPEDQATKAPVIEELASLLASLPRDELDPATRDRATRLARAAASKPFGAEDLPRPIRQLFATKDGAAPAHIVLLFPSVSLGEAEAVRRLAGQLREVQLSSGQVLAGAGEPMVLADILETVDRDAPRIFGLTLVFIVATLWLTLGKLRLGLLALAPAILTVVVTMGLLPVLGLELDYLNMIILPILLGIGVDDGAHIVARVDAGEPLVTVWRHTGWDITGAILTDAFGFGVLALAAHPGLAGLGQLALVGLAVNLVACTLFLPAMLAVMPLVGPRVESWSYAWAVTVLGAGKTPIAPGTVGALAALPLAWWLAGRDAWITWVVVGGVIALAVLAVRRFLADPRRNVIDGPLDPQEIVIDEFAGCLLALAFVPFEPFWVVGAVILFRVFDIWKPGPIRWIDRHVHGAVGIVVDDVAAGLLAGGVLVVVRGVLSI